MKRLYRSSHDRVFAGVAAGLGEYFDIDPVLIRALFVAGVFLSGVSIIVYLALWIIMPQRKPSLLANTPENATAITPEFQEAPAHSAQEIQARKRRASALVGVLLIVLGSIILFEQLFPAYSLKYIWRYLWQYILPLTLIGVGAFLIWKTRAQSDSTT
ncbi:MAG: PspC domain-containing protein [Candidatus Thermochlorobacter sp.]